MGGSVIGIISYLPDNSKIRDRRLTKLIKLVLQCNYIFNNLPIMIIAQNWTDEELNKFSQMRNIKFFTYDKLGITGARNKLREHFLYSDYQYLIMLDDDVSLNGGPQQGLEYLRQLHLYKNGFWEFNLTLLKLFAISKDLFSKEKFDDSIQPENEGGFEDRIFVNKLRSKYPDLRHQFNVKGLSQSSLSTRDPDSTWYVNQDIQKMREKTNNLIDSLATKFNDNIKN